MCGIFGFVGRKIVLGHLATVAFGASRRGPDAWGIAAWQRTGAFVSYRERAKFTRFPLGLEKELRDAVLVVGHCRLATSGELDLIQPLRCGNLVIAHNGNYYEADETKARMNLAPATSCDSEVLGLAIEKEWCLCGNLARATDRILDAQTKRTPFALLISDGVNLVARSDRQPLFADGTGGTYYTSVKPI